MIVSVFDDLFLWLGMLVVVIECIVVGSVVIVLLLW